jgi:hypothetical protein
LHQKDWGIQHIHTFGHYIAWATGPTKPDRVEVLDLSNGREKTVAQAERREGVVDYARGSNEALVYVEVPVTPSDDRHPEVTWKLKVVDLERGATATIAERREPEYYANVPQPVIEWPWVVWSQAVPGDPTKGQAMAYDLRSHRSTVLLPSSHGGIYAITGGKVVFSEISHPGMRDIYFFTDIFEMAATGGPITQLTQTGSAADAAAAYGYFAWPVHTVGYESLWVQPLDPSKPALKLDGDNQGEEQLGDGFVTWRKSDGSLVAAPFDGASGPIALAKDDDINSAARYWVDGSRVVWGTWNQEIHIIQLASAKTGHG